MSEAADKLKAWRIQNPEKYLAQRERYADKARAARKEWRRRNRETERAAAQARRRNDLAYRIAKRYDYNIAEARVLADALSPACEICQKECKLHFDHDHKTGRHRGWLCPACNRGMGFLGDDPARLRAAANYLEERAWTPITRS